MIFCVLTLLLSAGPERYLYEFSVHGTPVGFVELQLDGTKYRYTSIHVFNRDGEQGGTKREQEFELTKELKNDDGRMPASLALVKSTRTRGCVDVVNELTGTEGQLCREPHGSSAITGKLLGKQFWAELEGEAQPSKIVFGSGESTFVRVERKSAVAPPDFTGRGFPVSGEKGKLAVTPVVKLDEPKLEKWAEKDARRLAGMIHNVKRPFCVDFVNAFIAEANEKGPIRSIAVHGLLLQDGRAFPHAWVRIETASGGLELDPTHFSDVTADRYLPLQYVITEGDKARAGAIWLSLISGERKVVRR